MDMIKGVHPSDKLSHFSRKHIFLRSEIRVSSRLTKLLPSTIALCVKTAVVFIAECPTSWPPQAPFNLHDYLATTDSHAEKYTRQDSFNYGRVLTATTMTTS